MPRWGATSANPWSGWGYAGSGGVDWKSRGNWGYAAASGPLEVNLGIGLGTVPATDTDVTLTSTVVTDVPTEAMFFGGIGVTTAVQAAGWQLSEGMTDGTNHGSATTMIINDVSTREADRRLDGDSVLMSNPLTEANKLQFNSFVAGGVKLDNTNFDGNETRVLIYSLDGNSFTQSLLFSYNGKGKLISAETAGRTGMLQIESKIVVR